MRNFIQRFRNFLAVAILALMFGLSIGSMAGDSAVVDEIAHIPAGYSYLKFGEYRLNPEHPPLLKDISAFPLLLMNLDFPDDLPAWTTDQNGQWDTGWHFLYHYGNDADKILFFARLPLLILAVGFGWFLYIYVRNLYGNEVGLLSLLFYALSPNVLSHAHFVTTDIGVAVFGFIAFAFFLKFIEAPSKKTVLIAAVTLALAQLAKFSAILLYPLFLFMASAAFFVRKSYPAKERAYKYLGGGLMIFILSIVFVWIFYAPHTMNMSAARQDQLITASFPSPGFYQSASKVLLELNHIPTLKPLVQYLLGILMAANRVEGGNTTYFLGQVSNQAFLLYFPVTFLIKTPLAFLAALFVAALSAIKRVRFRFKRFAETHFFELSSLTFIVIYSYTSITGNLNLGIRHLSMIMPFVIVLVSLGFMKFYALWHKKQSKLANAFLGLIVLGTLYPAIASYPSYLPYINELVGGPDKADRYLSDSNVDWGQDLKRLVSYVQSHPEIDKIAVDYFGGGDPKYYFCKRRYDANGSLIKNITGYDCSDSPYYQWSADWGVPPFQHIAVSEDYLVNDLYWAPRRGDAGLAYLRAMKPIAKIGYSIYIYKLDNPEYSGPYMRHFYEELPK